MEEKKLSYAPEVTKALEIAQKIARENMNARYSGGHLLKAVLNRDLPLLKLLESKGVDVFYLEEWAEVRIEEALKATNTYSCDPDEVIDTIFTEAEAIREILDEEEITHEFGHMLGNKEEYSTIDGIAYGEGRQTGKGIMNNPSENPNKNHFERIRLNIAKMLDVDEKKCIIMK